MTKRKSDFTLLSYDDIFTTQEMQDDAKLEKFKTYPLPSFIRSKTIPLRF